MAEQGIVSVNMTNFFNREIFLYSLGDIRFKKPKSLKKMAYLLGSFIVWTAPVVLIFGIHFNIFFAVIALGPPFLITHVFTKPIFGGGKTFFDFARTAIKFIGEPKAWTDLRAANNKDETVYDYRSQIWISRRRELQILADMYEEETGKK